MSSPRLCPRCQYVRRDMDSGTMPGICPACGIAYHKWNRQADRVQVNGVSEGANPEHKAADSAPPDTAMDRIRTRFLYMHSDRDESAFWAHIVICVLVTGWGWRLIAGGVDFSVTGSTFLHVVNGAFHQYGHIVFKDYGVTFALLGGSLLQILVPLGLCAYFTLRQGDNFPASLMLWWVGENFLDIAPYVADNAERAIVVPETLASQHDWNALLGDSPGAGDTLAQFLYFCGVVIILFSNYWGFSLLRIEFKGRTGTLDE